MSTHRECGSHFGKHVDGATAGGGIHAKTDCDSGVEEFSCRSDWALKANVRSGTVGDGHAPFGENVDIDVIDDAAVNALNSFSENSEVVEDLDDGLTIDGVMHSLGVASLGYWTLAESSEVRFVNRFGDVNA